MPQLEPAEWILIRKAYEAGSPARELGRRFGIDDKTLRTRANREGWVKPPGSREVERASRRTASVEGPVAKMVLRRIAAPEPPRESPHAARTSEADGEEDLRGAFNEALELIADQVEISRERVRALADSRAMGNLDRLQRLFDRYMGLLELCASFPDPEDEPATRRRGEALSLLTIGRGDSLVGHIQGMLKVAVEIQTQAARLCGVEPTKPNLHLHQHQHQVIDGRSPVEIDESRMRAMAQMSTDQLATIWQASRLLEGNTARPPIPTPPADPGERAGHYSQD